MLLLQQSEATAAYRRIPIYLVDVTNGYTPETGLSAGFTIEVSENGAAQAAGGGSITEIGEGQYYYEATAAELSTLGFLAISIRHASCRDFFAAAQVVPWDPYLDFVTNISDIETDTNEIQGKLPTNNIMGSSVLTAKDDEIDAIKAVTDLLPNAGALTDIDTGVNNIEAKLPTGNMVDAADVNTEVDNALDTIIPGVPTAGSINDVIKDLDGKLPTNNIMGSSVKTDKDTNIDNIETDTNEIQGKLPTNNIMGSSVLTAMNDEIDAIKAKTDSLNFDGANVLADIMALNPAVITSGAFTAGAIDASAIAANAITSSEFAQSAADLVWGTVTRTITGGTITTVSDKTGYALTVADKDDIADRVWDENIVTAHDVAQSSGRLLEDLGALISARTNNSNLNALLGVADTVGTDLPEQVWSETTRAITDKAGFTISGTTTTFDALDTLLDAAHGAGSWATATGFSTHTAADVWSVGARTITGGTITTVNDKTGYYISGTITTLDGLNNLSAADVNAQVDTALIDIRLDELINVLASPTTPTIGSFIDRIMNKDGSQTFSPAADSLEAIRDRGDAAWITGGGGGITDIVQVIPNIPQLIDIANTKTIRLALYLINSLDDLPTTVEITPGTIDIDRSADGGTTWSSIVSGGACSEHAGAIYYDEVFDSATGYVAGDMIRITFKGQKITVAANDYEITDSTNGMIFYSNIQKLIPSETITDYRATGFSTHNQTDVWSVATRALTDKAGFTIGGTTQTFDALDTLLDAAHGAGSWLSATGFSVHSAADVWTSGTRSLTDKVNFALTAADKLLIADDVWDELISGHVTVGTFGAKNQLVVPSETINDYKADVSALATEANATTNKNSIITEVDANETKIDALNNLSSAEVQTVLENNDLDHLIQVTAGVEKPTIGSYLDKMMNKNASQTHDPTTDSQEAQVDAGGAADWSAGEKENIRDALGVTGTKTTASGGQLQTIDGKVDTVQADLDSPNQYKADVSALATEANATTNRTSIITEVNANEAKIDIIQADLDSPAQYKADVSALSTEANATVNKNAIITEVNANETKIDTIDGVVDAILVDTGTTIPATITTLQTDLDNPNQYKADVSALATEANATTNKNTIITEIDANETKLDTIISNIEETLALSGKKNVVTEHAFDANHRHTGFNMWCYNSIANKQLHDKSTGLLYKYKLDVYYDANIDPWKIELEVVP